MEHLGRVSNEPVDNIEPIPWDKGPVTVRLECSEFTSHCPVTGQPDFAKLSIEYVPQAHILETKSLKLFLWRYRDRKQFNEALVAEIADELNDQLKPKSLTVSGAFNARGGIQVNASAHREAP